MKSFKHYLKEQVRWSGSLSDKLFDVGMILKMEFLLALTLEQQQSLI